MLAHGDSLGAGASTAVPDAPLWGPGLRSRHRRCEPPPMSIWSSPPHSFPPGPTPSAATRCMSGGPCSISELRLSRETHGWSHRFRSWQGSSTGTFFEKNTRWNKDSEQSTSGTGSWFVDTSSGWCRTPGRQPPWESFPLCIHFAVVPSRWVSRPLCEAPGAPSKEASKRPRRPAASRSSRQGKPSRWTSSASTSPSALDIAAATPACGQR